MNGVAVTGWHGWDGIGVDLNSMERSGLAGGVQCCMDGRVEALERLDRMRLEWS